MSFNIDDPTTWPTDSDELLKLASSPEAVGGTDPGAANFDADEDDTPTDTPDEAPAAAADTTAGKPTEKPKEETKDETKEETKDETKEETKDETKDEPEPAVLAADGKHTLPYSVLRGLRDENQRLKQELANRAQPPAEAPVTQPAQQQPPATPELPVDVTAKLDDLREKWGDEVADMYRDQYQLKQQLAAQERQLAEVNTARQQDADRQARNEEEQIQTAIDSTPLLAAWQADNAQPEWYQRAVKMNEFLMANDTDYARKSWGERMAELPTKVQALYGDSPHAQQLKPATSSSMPAAISNPDTVKQKAAEKAQQAANQPPTTLSDIKSGQTADAAADDPLEQVGRMNHAQLYEHMQKLSADPAKFAAYLSKFS